MGIGKELAHQVLKAGGKVVLTARNADKLEKTRKLLIRMPITYWYIHQMLQIMTGMFH